MNPRAILAHTHRLVALDPISPTSFGLDSLFLVVQFVRNDTQD